MSDDSVDKVLFCRIKQTETMDARNTRNLIGNSKGGLDLIFLAMGGY